MSRVSLGPGWSRGPVRDQHGPHLVTVKVSQMIGIQSHPSLLIDIRSGEAEAEGKQSKGLGIRGEAPRLPPPPLAATYKIRNSQVQGRKEPKWPLRKGTLPIARMIEVRLKVRLPNLKTIFFNVYLFLRERDRAQAGEGQRDTETQNPKQAPGCELSAQSPTWGSNS